MSKRSFWLARVVGSTFTTKAVGFAAALPALPDTLAATLARPITGEVVKAHAGATPILKGGFGLDLVTAQEAALKMQERA